MTKTKNKRNEGFTLIEVVMSLALMTFGLGASMSAISQAIQVAGTTRSQQTALHEARRQMEVWRGWKANDFTHTNLVAGTYQLFDSNHAGQVVVTDVDANTKTISVHVNYATMQVRASGTIDLNMSVVRAVQE